MKLITTSIILALAGLSLGDVHIKLPIPSEKDLKGAVPGYLLVKYKKEDAAAPPLSKDQELLTEIRDLLKSRGV